MVTYDPREDDTAADATARGGDAAAVDAAEDADGGLAADAAGVADDATSVEDGGMSDRAQWLVVVVLFVSGILAPLYLYVVGPGSFGLGFRDTYLAVPMVPAILLAAVGVWTAVRGG